MSERRPVKKVQTQDEMMREMMGDQYINDLEQLRLLKQTTAAAQQGDTKAQTSLPKLATAAKNRVAELLAVEAAVEAREKEYTSQNEERSSRSLAARAAAQQNPEEGEQLYEDRQFELQRVRSEKDVAYHQSREDARRAMKERPSPVSVPNSFDKTKHGHDMEPTLERRTQAASVRQQRGDEARLFAEFKELRRTQEQGDSRIKLGDFTTRHSATVMPFHKLDGMTATSQHFDTGSSARRIDRMTAHNTAGDWDLTQFPVISHQETSASAPEVAHDELVHASHTVSSQKEAAMKRLSELELARETNMSAMRQLEEDKKFINDKLQTGDATPLSQRGEYNDVRKGLMAENVRIVTNLRDRGEIMDEINSEIEQIRQHLGQAGGARHNKIQNRLRVIMRELLIIAAQLAAGPGGQVLIDLNNKQTKLQLEQRALTNELTSLRKTRNFMNILPSYKINDLFEEYDEAIKAVDALPPGSTTGVMLRGFRVFDLERVKELMLDEDDYMTLLFAFSEKGIKINNTLPDMPPIVKSQVTIRPHATTGILSVVFNNTEYQQPNPVGLPNERKAFSAQYNRVRNPDTCGGFGDDDPTANVNCLEILRKCLAGDKNSIDTCKDLFIDPTRWNTLMNVDITNSNLYVLGKFLSSIGYPLNPTNHKEFDPNIKNWYSTVNKKYSTSSTELDAIKQNTQLTTAISAMVKQYNLYMNELQNHGKSKKQVSHMKSYSGGVNNFSKINNLILSGGGYFKTEQQVSLNSLRKLVKDTENVAFVANTFKGLFKDLELRINKQGLGIDRRLEQDLQLQLADFETTEKKLNKLLVLFSNFAWMLTEHGDSGSDEAQNKKDKDDLTAYVTEESMEAYIAARDKIIKSLQKKQKQMIITFSPLFNISYPQ